MRTRRVANPSEHQRRSFSLTPMRPSWLRITMAPVVEAILRPQIGDGSLCPPLFACYVLDESLGVRRSARTTVMKYYRQSVALCAAKQLILWLPDLGSNLGPAD